MALLLLRFFSSQQRCDSEIISLLNQKLAGFLLNQRAPAARAAVSVAADTIQLRLLIDFCRKSCRIIDFLRVKNELAVLSVGYTSEPD